MAEYKSETIQWLIERIEKQRVVLPAIQRSFIWPEEKICGLFDSLLCDYPIGTFLFWDIDGSGDELPLNQFVLDFDEADDSTWRGGKITEVHDEYLGVLDGQQRITSLYLGLCGKRRVRRKGAPKKASSSYVNKRLCLNVLYLPDAETGSFDFAFVEEKDIKQLQVDEKGVRKLWVPVSVALDSEFKPIDYCDGLDAQFDLPKAEYKCAMALLDFLRDAIQKNRNVNYYLASKRTLSQVVEMFVRVNSGGVKLSASDLMLSVAAGEQHEDVHVKLRDAINTINSSTKLDGGFEATKDLVLQAGLMCVEAKSLSLQNKDSYTKATVNKLYEHWDQIVDALSSAARLIEYIGLKGSKLTSQNLIIPIAYYLYRKHAGDNYVVSTKARKDRIFIRQWLLRAMVNSIFRDGTGSTLLRIREVLRETKRDYFPLDDLMAAPTKRKLQVSEETIEEMLDYTFGSAQTAPLLMELCQASGGEEYHIDHIWPKAILLKKRELSKRLPLATEEEKRQYKEKCHCLANLQPLQAIPNQEKGDTPYKDWLFSSGKIHDQSYFQKNCIPVGLSYEFDTFLEFIEKREDLLRVRIRECLPDDFESILDRYNLR